jgi:hypothetical protein
MVLLVPALMVLTTVLLMVDPLMENLCEENHPMENHLMDLPVLCLRREVGLSLPMFHPLRCKCLKGRLARCREIRCFPFTA